MFNVGRSMFDVQSVQRLSFKTILYGTNVTCECLQNNLALMHIRSILKNESGIALFLVLWVLTLLTVIVGEFCYAMRTEVNITRNFKELTQSYYIAMAGFNRAVSELVKNRGKPPGSTSLEAEQDDEIRWRINAEIPPVSFAQGQFEVRIDNESGKINLNTANKTLLKMALSGFDIEDTDINIIIDSVLDWRDKDNLHRVNGAESDYYLSLPDPYNCGNRDFESIDELLLVRGMTFEIFYGGFKDLVSVYQDETAKKSQGTVKKIQSRININAAPSQLLMILPEMTEDLVKILVEYRKEEDIESLVDLVPILGINVYKEIMPFITLEFSSFYAVRSVGSIKGSLVKKGVQALVKVDLKEEKKYTILQWIDRVE